MQTSIIDMRVAVDSPTCPLCHTREATVTRETLDAGARWACATCGQVWSARRLDAVASYARYVDRISQGGSL
jgi:transposase-like protein